MWFQAADPGSKGIVENLVGYAKSDLLVPLLVEDDGTPTIAEANTRRTGVMRRSELGGALGDRRRPGRPAPPGSGSCFYR